MKANTRTHLVVVLLLSSLLALVGQYYFAAKRDYLWDGVLLYAAALFLFLVAGKRLDALGRPESKPTSSLWGELWDTLGGSRTRLSMLLVGCVVVLYVAMTSGARSLAKPFWDLLTLWLLGIALVVVAFSDWPGAADAVQRIAHGLRENRPETLFVAVIGLVTFVLRRINPGSLPMGLFGDEAAMGLEAVNVLEGRLRNPFSTGWFANPTLYFFVQALFLRLFRVDGATLRLTSALASSGTAVALYLFARHYFGRWTAMLATVLFATYHYGIHYGRMAINNIFDPVFALGIFYCVGRGIGSKKLLLLLIAGVLTGLSAYFHAGARLIPIILVIYLLYWTIREPEQIRKNLPNLIVFALVTVVVGLPLFRHFITNPTEMIAPWTRKSMFTPGRLESVAAYTGKDNLTIMFDQFVKSVLAFNYSHDPTFFYRPGIPLLQYGASLFFVFGFVQAMRRWRQHQYMLLVIWYVMVITFGGALLENPPASHRLLLAIPPVVICVALGIITVLSCWRRALQESKGLAVGLSVVLVLLLSFQSLSFYFDHYAPSHKYTNVNDEVANRLGTYLHGLGPEYRCYFFGAPRVFSTHPPIAFLSGGVPAVDVARPYDGSPDLVRRDRDAVFVFVPERVTEFDLVRQAHPDGLYREFRGESGNLLFSAYEVDVL